MRALHVLFYRPCADDHWLNRLVTTVAPPFSHCDLQFDDGLATSVYQRESVYMETKSLSRDNYERVSIAIDEGEHERIRDFCTRAHRDQVVFDPLGMALCVVPRAARLREAPLGRTFCSRYILEALQQTGRPEFAAHDPACTTPSALYRMLKEYGREFIHIPEKRLQRLAQSGVSS